MRPAEEYAGLAKEEIGLAVASDWEGGDQYHLAKAQVFATLAQAAATDELADVVQRGGLG
jgi:hypothetical protein